MAREHGLSDDEFNRILEILGREPNYVELGIFSVMWSEHCSYKSSIKMLKTFPREGSRLLVEAGEENAGLVDLGDGLATAFKIESHNHPSAVEPYEGAATGVGGIMRDVFTMGARPIASMNSLRFGSLERARNRYLLDHVVEGIADYGNCLGIPTVGGEVVIEDSYSGNCLVNAMSLGIVETKYVSSAIAKGVGNPVYIVGSTTGRDGIHGATFASVELTEETESKRSNVQVGDPFTEKLLMEASLELCKKLWLVGIQDMGAAGITCSCSEMSAKGESGIKIDLDKVPLREDSMNAYEIMLSESQERMLVVIEQGFDKELNAIFEKWELDCTRVGEVTDTGMLEVYHRGNKVAEIPSEELVLGGGAPQYDMPVREPAYFSEINNFTIDAIQEEEDYNKTLLTLLSTPNITSKQFVFRQYDSTVRSNTVQGPGGAAAVIRLKGTQKGLAMSTDCNGRYVYLNPRMGGQIAVVESARNVVCSGGEPLAITNCLNFGNPQDPEIYWQFKEAVTGIGEACRALNTPVTGGNVSFYNETGDTAVYPTPVIGMVGLLENINQSTTIEFKGAGDFIVTLGALNGCLGGSEYLRTIHGKIQGPIPHLNLELEMGIQELCLEAIKKGIIKSAHDLSDGGLAVNISESIVHSKQGLGARLDVVRKLQNNELLFGECQSVIVVTLEESALYELILLAQKLDMHTQTIGRVTDTNSLVINDQINISRIKMENAYFKSLEKIMTQ
ncbi:MAG TPA: phosphoribosylformylglycinamidine synthase subunit PurL [Candidatus Marinimicrobia bacterium]|nr:phosphoribosylformylglycinamidine synthase subunit PurL [Candidatus Neomarinimicrobiota bacterium]HIG51043.1 phosphoribosylformylglycinamidine synthase subunit PurL [Candidatus Neomarinimicrobiota bacterium]HIM53184.1 phosphoribosylformylglycinamidine synthase subunit PurL [Candidatus Neomarinimicrobiota bacterium]